MSKPRQDFMWKVHDYVSNNIRFADTKAALSFAFSSGLLSWITSQHNRFADPKAFGVFPTILLWTGVACLLASILLFAWSLIPRLWARTKKGLIFWEQVALYDNGNAYESALEKAGEPGLDAALAEHIHIMARLASRKFALIGTGVMLAAAGTALVAFPVVKIAVCN